MFIYTICMQKSAQLSSQNVMLLPQSDSHSNEVRVTFFSYSWLQTVLYYGFVMVYET